MRKRLNTLLICCALALSLGAPALAMVFEPPTGGEESAGAEIPVNNVKLGGVTIGAGETLSYTVVGSQYEPEEGSGFYAGQLNLTITGPIVIESGGCLSIGPISIGGPEERAVIKAALGDTPLITVEAGGQLIIHYADFALTGEGTLIAQEPGAAISLIGSTLPDGAAAWSCPVVDNGSAAPDDVYLELGTALTPELLPGTLDVSVLDRGQELNATLALSWELGEHLGQREGEAQLTGSFLDENGEVLLSLQPLTLTVHWYAPGELVVTDARWTGGEAVTATLFLDELPDGLWHFDVRGQTSPDGENWSDFADFEVLGDEEDGYTATFYLYDDNEPRYFRLAASNGDGSMYWYSDGYFLPTEEDSDEDQGGNRGGSTTLFPPEREPEPTPEPTPQPTPQPTPTPSPEPESTPAPPVYLPLSGGARPEPAASPSPEPSPASTTSPASGSTSESSPAPSAQDVEIDAPDMPEQSSSTGIVSTVLLAAAGVCVCVLVGKFAAKLYKKRK